MRTGKILKAVILALMTAGVLTGCTVGEKPVKPISTTAVSTAESIDLKTEYSGIMDANRFKVISSDELSDLLDHGTAVIYLGFPECPWCQAYMPMLETAAGIADIKVNYYNIYKDKTGNRKFYDKIAKKIADLDGDIINYDNDGKYRIMMPLVLAVNQGSLVGYDNETSSLSAKKISPDDYWTDEKKEALILKLSDSFSKVKSAQDSNDTGCAADAGACKLGSD